MIATTVAQPTYHDTSRPWCGKDINGLSLTKSDLIERIERHDQWLKTKGIKGEKLNLSMANLIGVDFEGLTLNWATLDGANLQGADLTGANLQGVRLRNANLQKASLVGSNLKWAYLEGANLQLANLTNSDLEGADLQKVNMQWAILNGANLQWAIMREANMPGVKLKDAKLYKANLIKTNLQWSRLDNASLKWANLEDSNIERSILNGANMEWSVLVNANLRNAKLIGTNLRGAKLHGADLRNCSLREANLYWADLEGARLEQTLFELTNLKDADLKYATFFDTNFELLPNDIPNISYLSIANHLHFLTFNENPHSLMEIKEAFRNLGLRRQERQISYAIHRKQNLILRKNPNPWKKIYGYMCWILFDVTCMWGMKPFRPLIIVQGSFLSFSLFYFYTLYNVEKKSRVWKVVSIENIMEKPSEKLFFRFQTDPVSALKIGCRISLSSTLFWGCNRMRNEKFMLIDFRRELYFVTPSWQLKVIFTLQLILSIFLLFLSPVVFWGRPFG